MCRLFSHTFNMQEESRFENIRDMVTKVSLYMVDIMMDHVKQIDSYWIKVRVIVKYDQLWYEVNAVCYLSDKYSD